MNFLVYLTTVLNFGKLSCVIAMVVETCMHASTFFGRSLGYGYNPFVEFCHKQSLCLQRSSSSSIFEYSFEQSTRRKESAEPRSSIRFVGYHICSLIVGIWKALEISSADPIARSCPRIIRYQEQETHYNSHFFFPRSIIVSFLRLSLPPPRTGSHANTN